MPSGNYAAITSAEVFTKFVDKLIKDDKVFGFDIESGYTGPNMDKGALLTFHPLWVFAGFSFTNSLDWARYVPVNHDNPMDNVDDKVQVARDLWRLLQTGKGVAHNAAFELAAIARFFRDMLWDDPELGEAVRRSQGMYPIFSDSQVEVHMLAEIPPKGGAGGIGVGLKEVTKYLYNVDMVHFDDLFKPEDSELGPAFKGAKGNQRFNTRRASSPDIVNYACEDSVYCLRLHLDHYPRLMDSPSKNLLRVENALIPVLYEMELEGLLLDWETVHSKTIEVLEFRDLMNEEILADLSERLGEVININLASTKQLGEILFERLGLPVKNRSEKTGEASTDEKSLRAIAKADPVIKRILEYREVNKLHGSYLKKYDTELNYSGNGRARPNHNQLGALTGRLSVDRVSYQQWPKPYHYKLNSGVEFKMSFRDLLISPTEYRILGYDFSQVELRVLAGMSNETALLAAFASGEDIHKATAASMFGIPLEKVTKKIRAQGKTLNFAVVYGSGAANIAEMLSTPEDPVTTEDAEILLEKYFAAFPGLRKWMDEKVIEGKQNGFVYTPFGRKFTVWEYQDSRKFIQSKGDRMCVNAPVQGGAADYMKYGMVRVNARIKKAEEAGTIPMGGIRLIMTVHDALEFYVHDSVDSQTVIDIVNPAVSFPVPGLPEIRADWHEGKTWGSVVEINLNEEKKIESYSIEDVDEKFATIVDAYNFQSGGEPEEAAPTILEFPITEAEEESQGEEEPPWWNEPQNVIVTVTEMPDSVQWPKFKEFLAERPGQDSVVLSTPQGDITFDTTHSISSEDRAVISLILGGASITTGAKSVSLAEVGAGVEL
jgi:DNA polymerase I-like protein with 3'-5' exonuclease and polymerase domains